MLKRLRLWSAVRRLRSQDEKARLRAIAALDGLRDCDTSKPLIAALDDRSSAVRAAAAEALSSFARGRDEALQVLPERLSHMGDEGRCAAAHFLGLTLIDESVEILVGMLEDYSSEVRCAAAAALRDGVKRPTAIESLVRALGDPEPEVRLTAAKTLGELGETEWEKAVKGETADFERLGSCGGFRSIIPLLRVMSRSRRDEAEMQAAAKGLAVLGKNALAPIAAALEDRFLSVRRTAVEMLGNLGDAKAVEPLLRTLTDSDEDVRLAAAKALVVLHQATEGREAELSTARITEVLLLLMGDTSSSVRAVAIRALGDLRCGRAIQPLMEALEDRFEDRFTVFAVAEALAKLGNQVFDPLLKILREAGGGQSRRRASAAEALGYLGDKRAVPPLIEMLRDADADIRARAAGALGRLGDRTALEPLLSVLKDKVSVVQLNAISSLGKLGDPRAAEPLCEVLFHDCWGRDHSVLVEAAEVLCRLLGPRVLEAMAKEPGNDRWAAQQAIAEAIANSEE